MSSFSKFSDLILAFIFSPIIGFLFGFLFLFHREIFSFKFCDILSKRDGLLTPPDYGSLSSTTAIIVGAMFPVAVYIMEKRSYLKNIEEKVDEIFSRNHEKGIENILKYNNEIREEILHQDQSLKFGITIFIVVSFLSSTFAGALVFLWGPPWFLFYEKYSVLLHAIIFSFFCSAIGSMYIKEFSFTFQRPFLWYANYLNNKKYLDSVLKKISPHKDINLNDLQKIQLSPRESADNGDKKERLTPSFQFALKYVAVPRLLIFTLCSLCYLIFVKKHEILTSMIIIIISGIIFCAIILFLDCYSVQFFSCALVYKEIFYEYYITISMLVIFNFIKIFPLVYFFSKQPSAGNFTTFFLIAAVDILLYIPAFYCYKRKQCELLCEAIKPCSENNSSLHNELDPLFIKFLNGYIEKNEKLKEMIKMGWRSGLGSEKKEQ